MMMRKWEQEDRFTQILIEYNKLCHNAGGSKDTAAFMKSKFPKKEAWRFFIDGDRQNEGDQQIQFYKKAGQVFGFPFLSSTLSFIKNRKNFCNPAFKFVDNKQIESYISSIADMQKTFGEDQRSDMTLETMFKRNRGWPAFNRTEPNYLQPLITTFNSLFSSDVKEEKIDHVEHSLWIHQQVTHRVGNLNYDKVATADKKNMFRMSSSIGYKLKDISSVAGLKEMLDRIEIGYSIAPESMQTITIEIGKGVYKITRSSIEVFRRHFRFFNNHKAAEYIFSKLTTEKVRFDSVIESDNPSAVIRRILVSIFDRYEDEIKRYTKPIDKLRSIISCIRDCEQLHPFWDGNCRTFCMIKFYDLLRANNFPIPIQYDPNRFNGFSIDEILDDVLQGMEDMLAVAQSCENLYGVSTDEILRDLNEDERREASEMGITFSQEYVKLHSTNRFFKSWLERAEEGESCGVGHRNVCK